MSSTAATQPASLRSRLLTAWSLFVNYAYDYRRFRSASFIEGPRTRENRRAHIHLLAHTLEYGMSLSDPRKGFGMEKVRLLCAEMQEYISAYGRDETVELGLAVMASHIAFTASQGADTAEARRLLQPLFSAAGPVPNAALGGTEQVRATDIAKDACIDFVSFMERRNSVRQYADRQVELEKIRRAVRAAQQTPSSCNRQTCKVYAFTDKRSIARVLSHHDGNRGFGDQLGGVFVVTVDLSHWNSVGERNQGWVDGGMFAMTLALGLHAEGLGACMLNWSAPRERDKALRACIGIPDHEIVITLIGFGHLRDEFRVPVSRRKSLEMVLRHEPPLN
ncbi:nitroreductase family protein [Chelativorans sp. J32]|uniref:nitroreductase family protein n=1 Tax=Chelativorans sp. J32 TaxID=935840 RepID=UPI000483AD1B|nr:nitroreductase family protein [Chelativorans sp. J32]